MPSAPLLTQRPLNDVLADVAAATPAPGAGSSSAWTAALAAGLAEMSAQLTLTHADYASVHERMGEISERAAELRAEALELAERDLVSYVPVLEAMRLPRDDPERAARIDAALSEAAEVPLAVARAALEAAEMADEVARTGNPALEGDAGAGGVLGAAACRAAARLVELNLPGDPDDPRRLEAAELARRAARI